MFKKFRKKPVVIEAFQYTKDTDPALLIELKFYEDGIGKMLIPTLEGSMRAVYGDWIIKGVAGEYYPCRCDIFENTYEAIND